MKIGITGGTGFIGTALAAYLKDKGHEIYIFTRKQKPTEDGINYIQWLQSDVENIVDLDIVINLAGESINSGRWSEDRKKRILNSRILATRKIIEYMRNMNTPPSVFINASAIGFYGSSLTKTFTEDDVVPPSDFLAETTHIWEKEAKNAEQLGVRTVYTRFGIVLHSTEGALPRMVLPYKYFIGGKVGKANQWMSWIHIMDAVRMIEFAINNESIQGPINVTAPNPVTMDQFGKKIASQLKRPHWLPVPSFMLHLLLGEMSNLILNGQKVLPQKAVSYGFDFLYVNLEDALQAIFS